MHSKSLIALAASLATTTSAQNLQGFNYGSTFTNGAAKMQSDFQAEFQTAQNLVGTSGFTSARLYTTIQAGTANTPISAIPAAVATKTTLLLGLWASAGQDAFNNELAALSAAIKQYGTGFTSLVTGISIGSEDLYRVSPIGIAAKSGAGAGPADIVSYINQVRQTISGTTLSGASIGHVDTWTAWVNGSNDAVISAVDWLGMDAYPYFQNTEVNDIGVSRDVFYQAYYNTTGVSGGKPVWVTETGWPISGPTENLAVPSLQNAQTYWNTVGCSLFGKVNTYWYTLQDAAPDTPSPSFGIVGSTLTTTPVYDLTCSAVSSSSSSSSSSSGTSATSSATATSETSSVASSVGASQIASDLPASSAGSGPIVGSAASSAATFEASSGAAATGNTSPTPGSIAPATSIVYTTSDSSTFPVATTLVTPTAAPVAPSGSEVASSSIVPGIVATNGTTYTQFPVTTVSGPVGPSTVTLTPTAAAPTGSAASSFGTGFVPSGTASASSSPIVSTFPGSAPSVSLGGFTAAMAAVCAFFAAL